MKRGALVITQKDTIKSVRKAMPPSRKVIKSKRVKRLKAAEQIDLRDFC